MSQKRYRTVEEVDGLVNRGRALSSKVATYNQRVVSEGDSLAQEITELSKEIDVALQNSTEITVTEELQRARAIVQGHGPGGDLRKLCKQNSPFLLSLLLGKRTNVVTLQRNDAIRLKEEYYGFLDRISIILFFFSSTLLLVDHFRQDAPEQYSLTPPYMACVQVFLCWLLYVYTALALRENVLKVNGSHIRAWWIRHHYFSVATCILVLALPVDSPAVQMFVRKWISWSCLQSIAMVLQNSYQRRRLYIRIALGKNKAMDVVSGETSGGAGQLLVLYPVLFALQIFQIVIGIQMMLATAGAFGSTEGWLSLEAHESDLRGSRGVAVAGLLKCYMGICNFKTTVSTILSKRQGKKHAFQDPLRPAGILEKVTDNPDNLRANGPTPKPAGKSLTDKEPSQGAGEASQNNASPEKEVVRGPEGLPVGQGVQKDIPGSPTSIHSRPNSAGSPADKPPLPSASKPRTSPQS